jgi:methylmalonyl-CoA mutase cobalamin-binding subunit
MNDGLMCHEEYESQASNRQKEVIACFGVNGGAQGGSPMRDNGTPSDQVLCDTDWLGRLVNEAIGHLVLVREQQFTKVKQEHLDHFMNALRLPAADEPATLVAGMVERRLEPEAIARLYVPEAARCLGQEWLDDEITFVDVTVQTERLHGVLRYLEESLEPAGVTNQRSVLVLVPEGEQHTLGAFSLAIQLRSAGFFTHLRVAPLASELTHLLAHSPFDLVLVSVGCSRGMTSAAQLIKALRLVARGPIEVIAGGSIPVTDEALLAGSGADRVMRDIAVFMQEFARAPESEGIASEVGNRHRKLWTTAVKGIRRDL